MNDVAHKLVSELGGESNRRRRRRRERSVDSDGKLVCKGNSIAGRVAIYQVLHNVKLQPGQDSDI